MREKIKAIMEPCNGWCTLEKGLLLTETIRDFHLKYTVEIGVWGGRSFFPQCYAHQQFTKGLAVGIDPWLVAEAMQVGFEGVNEVAKKVDFEALYAGVVEKSKAYASHCKILRTTSAQALSQIPDGIELLHIDGNHGEAAVFYDVTNYFPKVKTGGFVWFDDVLWASTAKSINYAKERCSLHREFENNVILVKL